MHDQLRIALCDLLATGSLKDPAGAGRQLMKLTRTSWALAYETVAVVFRDAADAISWQIRALLAALCVLVLPRPCFFSHPTLVPLGLCKLKPQLLLTPHAVASGPL